PRRSWPTPSPQARGRIVKLVFARPALVPVHRVAIAFLGALLLHAALFAASWLTEPTLASGAARLAARVHAELGREEIVDVSVPKPPPPPPPQPPAVAEREPAPRLRAPRPAAPVAKAKPVPPAQAAKV